uniref:Uncharacterized protein n=1 Tax=Arundo donax TaxID=35708 RepID=A0A0A9G305_ARUDO
MNLQGTTAIAASYPIFFLSYFSQARINQSRGK